MNTTREGEYSSQVNAAIESLLHGISKPVGAVVGGATEGLASLFGAENPAYWGGIAQQSGEELPRLALQVAAQRLGPVGKIAALGDVANQAYATAPEGMSEASRLGYAALPAVAFAAAPKIAEAVGGSVGPNGVRGLAPMVSKPLGSAVEKVAGPLAGRIAEKGLEKGSGLAGMLGAFEASKGLQGSMAGQPYGLSQALSPENLVATAATILPFEALGAGQTLRGYKPTPEGYLPADITDLFKKSVPGQLSTLAEVSRVEEIVKPYVMTAEREMKPKISEVWEPGQADPFGWKVQELFNIPENKGKVLNGSQIAGRYKNLFPDEAGMLEPLGFDTWLKGQKQVRSEDVQGWLKANAPRVEVKPVDANNAAIAIDSSSRRMGALQHEAETNGFRAEFELWPVGMDTEINRFVDLQGRELAYEEATPIQQRIMDDIVSEGYKRGTVPATTSDLYHQVNSRDISKPGPLGDGRELLGSYDVNVTLPIPKSEQIRRDRAGQPINYKSPHEGIPNNTAVQIRGNLIRDKDGSVVFEMVELQSDWAASGQETPAIVKQYEQLGVKAAMVEAVKRGATKFFVPDAETAMMTEQHDRVAGEVKAATVQDLKDTMYFTPSDNSYIASRYGADWQQGKYVDYKGSIYRIDDPNKNPDDWSATARALQPYASGGNFIPQAAGMKLHYDLAERAPGVKKVGTTHELAQGLTGDRGTRVELGKHNNRGSKNPEQYFFSNEKEAIDYRNTHEPDGEVLPVKENGKIVDWMVQIDVSGSSVFKEGSRPKQQITGNLYDLTTFKANLASRGGVPLLGKKLVMPAEVKKQLEGLESVGWDATDLAKVSERLGQKTDPEQLPKDVAGLMERITSDLGMTGERKRIWTQAGQVFVQRIAPTLKSLRAVEIKQGTGTGGVYGTENRGIKPFVGITLTKGLPEDLALNEAFYKLGHEVFHALDGQAQTGRTAEWSPKMAEAYKAITRDVDKLDQADMTNAMQRLLEPYGDLGAEQLVRYTPDATGRQEFLADSFGVFTMSLTQGKNTGGFKNLRDTLQFGDANTREILMALVKDFGALVQRLMISGKEMLGFNLTAKQRISRIQESLVDLVKTAQQAEDATQAFLQIYNIQNARPWAPMDAIDYSAIQKLYKEPFDPDLKLLVEELSPGVVPTERKPVKYGKRLGFFDYLKPIAQLTREWPELMSSWRLGRNYNGAVSAATHKMWEKLVDANGNRDIKGFVRLKQEGTPINRAFTKIGLKQQELEGAREGDLLTEKEMRAIPEYEKLSPEDKTFVRQKQIQIADAVVKAAEIRVNAVRLNIGHNIAKVLMTHDPNLSWELADELGQALTVKTLDPDMRGAVALRPQDAPELVTKLQEAEASLAKYTNQEVLDKGVGVLIDRVTGKPTQAMNAYTQVRHKLLGKWGADETGRYGFNGKPGYLPEVRLGRFAITFTEANGTPHYEGFKSKAEFQKRLDALNPAYISGKLKTLKYFDKEDQADAFRGLRPDAWAAFQEAENQLYNSVLAQINQAHPEAKEILSELKGQFKPGEAAASILEPPYMKERRLVAGRENLNMAEGLVHYINSTAWQTAKMFAKGQRSLILMDPKLKEKPQLRAVARQYLAEIIDSTEADLSGLKGFAALNYLFFNPSQLFVEMTQQFTTHVPALVNQGMSAGDAYKASSKALADLYVAWVRGKNQGKSHSVFDTKEETIAMQEAIAKRVVDAGWLSEVFHLEEDLAFVNSSNVLSGSGSVLSRDGLVGKPLYQLFQLGRKGYSSAIAMNTRAAFLSSFRMYQKQGKSYQESFKLASDLTQESMFGGGRANRPLWFLGIGKGADSTVGGVMYMLQSYTYNAIAQQARYLKHLITNSELSPAGRYAAGRAAGLALATNVVLAGVSGIPLAGAVFALIEQWYPQAEPRRRIREYLFREGEHLNQLTGLEKDDRDLGELLSRAGLDGLANLGPVNLGSRFSLGGILGVNPNSGFSWEQLIGPAVGLFDKVGKAASQLVQGDIAAAAVEAIPNNPIQRLARFASDGWVLRNQDERMNLELSKAEQGLLLAGFTPKRVADFRNLEASKRRAEAAIAFDQKKFHSQMAEAMIAGGNPQELRQKLLERMQLVENYDPRAGARQIAEIVLARTTPYDPTRETSKVGGAYNVEKLFGPHSQRISEVDRMIQKQNLTAALGFPSPVDVSALRKAAMLDQVIENQQIGRTQALAEMPGRRRF